MCLLTRNKKFRYDTWKVAIRSYTYPAIFKMHECDIKLLFSYIYGKQQPLFPTTDKLWWAKHNNATLEIELELKENHQNICMQVIYYYKYYYFDKQPAIKVQILNWEQNTVVLKSELQQNYEDSWQIKEVQFENLTAMKYKIVIIVPETVSIGGVYFCNGNNGK